MLVIIIIIIIIILKFSEISRQSIVSQKINSGFKLSEFHEILEICTEEILYKTISKFCKMTNVGFKIQTPID